MQTYNYIEINKEAFLKAENPYNMYTGNLNPDWKKFEANNPPIPLINPIPGKLKYLENEVREVWQIETTKGWSKITDEEYAIYKDSNAKVRKALEPIPVKEEAKRDAPKKVCYCGSLRVAGEAFKKAEYEAVINGVIALLPCCMYVDIQREFGAESDYKIKADELHKRKIDICDEVFVLNVNGYIGDSTRSEIDYAKSINKPINYLEALTTNP